jgi:subfamily B ATP-binding cassette protein HlyB/CyaB
MSVIPQEAFLFNKTIAENIAVATKNININRVIEAATLAGAAEFIERMPAKYETNVGEFGSGLSGGQKQRIAIARAIYRDSKIIIMDEPTSAMDYESEVIFKNHLDKICEGRTVIILSHRYDIIRKADRIAIMKQGQCNAVGTHDELMSYSNFYSNSFDMHQPVHNTFLPELN